MNDDDDGGRMKLPCNRRIGLKSCSLYYSFSIRMEITKFGEWTQLKEIVDLVKSWFFHIQMDRCGRPIYFLSLWIFINNFNPIFH